MRESPGPRMPRRSPLALRGPLAASPAFPLLIAAGAVLLLLVWLLFLPPFSLLLGGNGWQDAGESQLVRRKPDAPQPPEDYELASPFYEIRSKQDRGVGAAVMTVPLDDGKAGRGLALYTWDGGRWDRLGAAEATDGGRAARGQVDRVPDNVAVMRRRGGGFEVVGILPAGAAPHPEAANLLTIRSPADYAPAADGSVSGNPSPGSGGDTVAVVPVVRATAGTESQAVNALLGAEPARAAHVAALVRLVQSNRLDGIELEYTALDPSLGGQFTALATAVAEQLRTTGQTLGVTLPLPRKEGNNWNTHGYDWKELGRVADYIRIAPERDQSLYRRNMRDALNFLTGQVDAKKLILTVSPHAVEKPEQGAPGTLSALEALSIAAQFSVRDRDRIAAGSDVVLVADNLNREGGQGSLVWDATAAAVSFAYQSGDALRTVWIENAFSTAFKLEFVHLWGLGGVAVDDASGGPGMANIWPAIADYVEDRQLTLLQPNSNLLKPQWLVDTKSVEVGKAVFTWKPTEAGEHTLALVVSDGVMRVQNQMKLTLRQGAGPSPTVTPSPTPARPATGASPTPTRAATGVSPTPTPRR